MVLRLLAVLIAALSFGPSFAHVLEAPPRLMKWSGELWREATVFNGQYQVFGVLGGPLDGGAILITAALAYALRGDRPAFWFSLGGAILYALSLIVWLSVVAPANSVMGTWVPGPLPADFAAIQMRWETGHMIIAGLKLLGLIAIVLSILTARSAVRAAS